MKTIRDILVAAACIAAATAAADPWDLASEAYVGHALAGATNGLLRASYTNGLLRASYTNGMEVALGRNAEALGTCSTAVGYGAVASHPCSTALGARAKATNSYSVVISTGVDTGLHDTGSHGDGTITLGVTNGLAGVWVGTNRMDAAIESSVRAAAYAVADYIFDAETSVCYRRMMRGGYLDYVAVTNVDVRLPENYAALVALEESR